MDAQKNMRGNKGKRANAYVRKSRVLARLTRLKWSKLLIPVLKDFMLRGQGYQEKQKLLDDESFRRPTSQRVKDFFKDPEVIKAVKEFFKASERDRQD
jgi:hypothetical protein